MAFLLPSQRLSDSCSPHLAFQRLPQSFGEILIKSSLDYYIKASKLALPRAPSHIQARSNLPKIPLSWSPVFLEEPLINHSFMLRKHCKPVPHVPTWWGPPLTQAGRVPGGVSPPWPTSVMASEKTDLVLPLFLWPGSFSWWSASPSFLLHFKFYLLFESFLKAPTNIAILSLFIPFILKITIKITMTATTIYWIIYMHKDPC